MRIVINAEGISDDFRQRELRQYYSECLIRTIRAEPASLFWVSPSQFFAGPEWIGIPKQNIILKSRFPFNLSFPGTAGARMESILRANQIDIVLSLGLPSIPVRSVPHIIWLADEEFGSMKEKNQKLRKLSEKGNNWLLTDSVSAKNFLVETFSWKDERIRVLPLAPSETSQAMSWTEKEQVKIKYAGGKEYFMVRSSCTQENIMVLLKAFSAFKKRQLTNMKLLIAGTAGEPDHVPHEKLESYKYRDDVHAYPGIAEKEILKLQGAAYALIQPAAWSSGLSVLNALQAEVPVISGRKEDEISGDTILYADPLGQESLGEAMSKLFTNEELRNDLIRKGRIWAAQFSIQQAVGHLRESLSSVRVHMQH